MLQINLLGPFEVIRGDTFIVGKDWGRRKTELLLKYFAAHRGRAITQEQLLEAIYPEQPNDKSVRNLLGRISELRRVLEPDLYRGSDSRFIRRVGKGTYMLPVDAPCTIDVEVFYGAVSAGMESARSESWHDAIRELERGVGLYRGDFLGEELYEEWTIPLRENLQERLREALLTLGLALRKAHVFDKAIAYYDRAIALNYLDESAYRGKMLAVYEAGDPARAEDVYATCIRLLADHDLEPEPETRELHEAVLARTIPRGAPRVRHNLPRYATPFFGREEELARIRQLLEAREHPVITLLGPGGIGKTRLAVEAAGEVLHHYPDGVFVVNVPERATVDVVLTNVAEAADIPLELGEEPLNKLLRSLRDKQTLLIFDNAERARGATDFLDEFVSGTQVQVMASSRERLQVAGEQILELGGLDYCKADPNSVSDPAELASYGACRLLRDRMRRVNESFEMTPETAVGVARICRITEGMPLAIELAATWGRVLSLAELARGIEESAKDLESLSPETPRKHRSMRAVFEHTWAHLTAKEQTVFARLTVLRESMSLAAALEVGACSLSTIMSLRDKALIRRIPGERYAIHELLRQYGNHRLASMPAEWEDAHAEHARFFTDLVARHTGDLFGFEQTGALAILHADVANIRAAWEGHVAARNYTALREAARGIFRYYQIQTNWHELHTLLQNTLDSLQEEERGDELPRVRALCYLHQGVALAFGSDLGLGIELLTKALHLSREIGDALLEGECLTEIGSAQCMRGEYEASEHTLGRALGILRELGARHATGRALIQLGVLHRQRRENEQALDAYGESLGIFRELGDPKETAGVLLNLGTVYGARQQWAKAKVFFEEALQIAHAAGQRQLRLISLANIGYLAYLEQDFPTAKETYRQAWELSGESSNFESRPQLAYYLCLVHTELGEYDEALRSARKGLATATELGSPPLILRNVYALGRLLRATGRLEEAAGLLRFALDHPATAEPTKRGLAPDFEALSKKLTPEIAERANRWAQSLTLEAIVEWAERTPLS